MGNLLALQNSALDTSGAGILAFSSGVNTPTFGGLTGANNLTLPSNVTALTLNLGSGVTQTYSGALGGGTSMTLTMTGTGMQVLSGVNTYSGGTTVSGGTLQLGDGVSNNGSVAGNITNNACLSFANPNAQTYTGAISGSGGVTKTGAGALTLAASNIYSGGTEVDDGTLVAANGTNGSATGSGTVTLNGGTLASSTSGGSISGAVQVGSVASEIAPGGIGSVGTLTIGSLITTSNLTLNFDLTTPGGNGDLLTITNGLTVGQGTPITFGTNPPTAPGDYPLIGGNFGTPNLSYFDLPAAPAGETYSLTTVGGYIDLVVVPEPSTSVLLGAAAIGLLGYARRRRRRTA